MNNEFVNTNIDRIPLKERNDFQSFLMSSMIGKDASIEKKIAWSDQYGKIVSDIIDNTKNEKIRDYIFSGDYGTATGLIVGMLKKEGEKMAA